MKQQNKESRLYLEIIQQPLKSEKQQSGATLIIVLLLLVALTSIAVVALRDSSTNLKIVTAAQVDKLLFQANDNAFAKLERVSSQGDELGLIDLLMSDNIQVGDQLISCFRLQNKSLFSEGNMTHKTVNGSVYLANNSGYCHVTNPQDYNNGGRVVTQLIGSINFLEPLDIEVSLTKDLTDTLVRDLGGNLTGNLTSQATNKFVKKWQVCGEVTVYAISVLPVISQTQPNQVNSCLQDKQLTSYDNNGKSATAPNDQIVNRLNGCLRQLSSVFRIHSQTYQLMTRLIPESDKSCPSKPINKGNGVITSNYFLNPTHWMAY